MSRIGKQKIEILKGVEVDIQGNLIKVKGEKGELEREIRSEIKVEEVDGNLEVSMKEDAGENKAYWGLTRSLIFNMVEGVSKGFEKNLSLVGVGYRAEMEGEQLVMKVGFSHPVKLTIPEGISVQVEKGKIKVSGICKEAVGQMAAKIRAVRPPEPYKGKGVRYEDEEIILKEGKKTGGE